MPSRRAKTLNDDELYQVLEWIDLFSRHRLRDTAMVLLSFKAALRACEIGGLSWCDVLTPSGTIAADIYVPDNIAKNGKGRAIPMNPLLSEALSLLYTALPPHRRRPDLPVIQGPKQPRMSPNNVQKQLATIYHKAGFTGVTSHSGRRTCLTRMAQVANLHGCSLYDVQDIAGHSDISTTETYVESSPHLRKLMGVI